MMAHTLKCFPNRNPIPLVHSSNSKLLFKIMVHLFVMQDSTSSEVNFVITLFLTPL